MRTSSVFAICCLAVGITSSNAQPSQPLPSIDLSPHQEALSSTSEEWVQHCNACQTHLRMLPSDPSFAHVATIDHFLRTTRPLRNNLARLHENDPNDWSVSRHLEVVDKTRKHLSNDREYMRKHLSS
ncbi:hypothetical protein F5148DRAFT_1201154 [Russula earlei]|uniref:Uncharacterized protein n=1 Tax=Russula earlei TaxID=71964 RepID=A0ACC0U8D1_9AGAM|nr:hypothetical protein F5148DRAFT_1201154 [Russula earlei]